MHLPEGSQSAPASSRLSPAGATYCAAPVHVSTLKGTSAPTCHLPDAVCTNAALLVNEYSPQGGNPHAPPAYSAPVQILPPLPPDIGSSASCRPPPPDRLDQLADDFNLHRYNLNSRLEQIEYSLEGAMRRGHANAENTSLVSARLDALSGHVIDLRQDCAHVNTALANLGGALDKAAAFAERLASLECTAPPAASPAAAPPPAPPPVAAPPPAPAPAAVPSPAAAPVSPPSGAASASDTALLARIGVLEAALADERARRSRASSRSSSRQPSRGSSRAPSRGPDTASEDEAPSPAYRPKDLPSSLVRSLTFVPEPHTLAGSLADFFAALMDLCPEVLELIELYDLTDEDWDDELELMGAPERDRLHVVDAWLASNLKSCIDRSSQPGKNFRSKLSRVPASLRSGRAVVRQLRAVASPRDIRARNRSVAEFQKLRPFTPGMSAESAEAAAYDLLNRSEVLPASATSQENFFLHHMLHIAPPAMNGIGSAVERWEDLLAEAESLRCEPPWSVDDFIGLYSNKLASLAAVARVKPPHVVPEAAAAAKSAADRLALAARKGAGDEGTKLDCPICGSPDHGFKGCTAKCVTCGHNFCPGCFGRPCQIIGPAAADPPTDHSNARKSGPPRAREQPKSVIRLKLRAWLKEHPDHPLARQVEADLTEIEAALTELSASKAEKPETAHIESSAIHLYGALLGEASSAAASSPSPLCLSGSFDPAAGCAPGASSRPSPAFYADSSPDCCMLDAAAMARLSDAPRRHIDVASAYESAVPISRGPSNVSSIPTESEDLALHRSMPLPRRCPGVPGASCAVPCGTDDDAASLLTRFAPAAETAQCVAYLRSFAAAQSSAPRRLFSSAAVASPERRLSPPGYMSVHEWAKLDKAGRDAETGKRRKAGLPEYEVYARKSPRVISPLRMSHLTPPRPSPRSTSTASPASGVDAHSPSSVPACLTPTRPPASSPLPTYRSSPRPEGVQPCPRERCGEDVDMEDIPVPPNEGMLYRSPESASLRARICASGSEYSLVRPPAAAEQPRRLISLKSVDMAPWYRSRLVSPSPSVPVDLDISHFVLVAVDAVSQYSYVVGASQLTHASWLALCRRVSAELSVPLSFQSDGSDILCSAAFVAAVSALGHDIAPAPRGSPRPVTGFPIYLGVAAIEVD